MKTSKPEPLPLSVELLDGNIELYEQHVIAGVDKCEDLWTSLSKELCWNPTKRIYVNDFSVPIHYAIYRAIVGWRQLTQESDNGVFTPIPEIGLRMQLLHLSQQATPIIDPDTVDQAISHFQAIRDSISAMEAIMLVSPTWRRWLVNCKVSAELLSIKRTVSPGAEQKFEDISAIQARILNPDAESDFEDFGAALDNEAPLVERIPLPPPFRGFNACLGGGLGKTEHIIIASPTGGGKTVFATQLGSSVAMMGKRVLFISTEQHSSELEPRIISALSGGTIPFDLVKDGGNYKKILSPTQQAKMKEIREKLKGQLTFSNWLGTGKSIVTDLEELIIKYRKKFGEVDVVILDWIGSALTAGIADSSQKIQTYLDAARTMKTLAAKYKFAGVSLAQATADSVDKPKITEKYLAECKTLHREAEAAFGLSALRNRDGEAEDSASYAELQYMFCFKSRKSLGKFFTVERQFEFQRFNSM